jgi:hypothetical protein
MTVTENPSLVEVDHNAGLVDMLLVFFARAAPPLRRQA